MKTLDTLTEKDFMQNVLDLARLTGWRCYHTHDSRRSEAGFPDLCLARRGRLVFAELKTASGRVTDAQRQWLGALSACPGLEVHVWRPADWPAVREVLR